MGDLKKKALGQPASEDVQKHKLTDSEMGYLKLLNAALMYHTLGQKILSGFLYYVATNRLGYKDGVNLSFWLDFSKDDGIVTITLLPDGVTELPPQPAETAAPAPAAEPTTAPETKPDEPAKPAE